MKKLLLAFIFLAAAGCAADVAPDDIAADAEALETNGCAAAITSPAIAGNQSKPQIAAELFAQAFWASNQPNSYQSTTLTKNGRWLGNFAWPFANRSPWAYVGNNVVFTSGCSAEGWRLERWGVNACFTTSQCYDGYNRLIADGVPSNPPPHGYILDGYVTFRVSCSSGARWPQSAVQLELFEKTNWNGSHAFYSINPDFTTTACRCTAGSNCL